MRYYQCFNAGTCILAIKILPISESKFSNFKVYFCELYKKLEHDRQGW